MSSFYVVTHLHTLHTVVPSRYTYVVNVCPKDYTTNSTVHERAVCDSINLTQCLTYLNLYTCIVITCMPVKYTTNTGNWLPEYSTPTRQGLRNVLSAHFYVS